MNAFNKYAIPQHLAGQKVETRCDLEGPGVSEAPVVGGVLGRPRSEHGPPEAFSGIFLGLSRFVPKVSRDVPSASGVFGGCGGASVGFGEVLQRSGFMDPWC